MGRRAIAKGFQKACQTALTFCPGVLRGRANLCFRVEIPERQTFSDGAAPGRSSPLDHREEEDPFAPWAPWEEDAAVSLSAGDPLERPALHQLLRIQGTIKD